MFTLMSALDLDWFRLLQIISIDIVLSGDNALIIALATKNLPKKFQNKAILIGVGGAIALRIIFASGIVYLLKFPFIYLIGGILLVWISYKLLINNEEQQHIASHDSVYRAVLTIITADVVMSLDNVVAIAGASEGNISLLAIGVLISIPLMIYGAKFIVVLLNKYSFLMYIGAGILVFTGADMIIHEPFVLQTFKINHHLLTIVLSIILTIGVIWSGYLSKQQHKAG
ncbi:integral membrane protein, YjbE family [Gracilibacillus ureilyticus]|uniref:Integral membrane protein, YjbE family n=1 Tax=Gracilibacillus ureilyticus TaxID=531814 RepID=A0A1H9LV77_9BACI|nr:TerC family protein [Gracilibacillus ureilyticus]SER15346.1 integral membrane protein, YjbE family [Gracilibacillus ureilyticus]